MASLVKFLGLTSHLMPRPAEDPAVAATAAELEEALQEVSRRGARIEALTCEVAWYRCVFDRDTTTRCARSALETLF